MNRLTDATTGRPAPDFEVSAWLNARGPLSLAALRGKVVVVHAFQMLCPACVLHGLPQMKKIAGTFRHEEVAVIGLHTVFEHHAAMGRVALEAFIHQYRIGFPVGIDRAGDGSPVPATMAAYGMRGTPTLLLFDRAGVLRRHHFGVVDDMQIGADIASLLQDGQPEAGCSDGVCAIGESRQASS